MLYRTRQILLDELTTSEYLTAFPILKQPEGYKLVIYVFIINNLLYMQIFLLLKLCDDFAISFPGKENCFRTNWFNICDKIINIAKQRKIEFVEIDGM